MKTLVASLVVMACNSSAPHLTSGPTPANAASLTRPTPPPGEARSPRSTSLRDKVLAINGHITVTKHAADFAEYRDVVGTARQIEGVISAEPFVFAEMVGNGAQADKPTPLVVKAIEPAGMTKLVIASLMTHGSDESLASHDLPSPILLGDGLANKLGTSIGDTITLAEPPGDPAWGIDRDSSPVVFRVGGIFHIGFDLYDDQLAYVTLTTMQGLRGRGDTVTGVEIRVKDLDRNGAIAHELDAKLGGPPYEVDDVLLLNADLVDH